MRLFSQLINNISRVFQKFLKCFDGTAISTFSLLTSAAVIPVIFISIDSNYSQSAKLTLGSSL